jgi:hypothetical protein
MMALYKFRFCIFFLTCFACNNNKNPYENKLGIEPSVIAAMDTAHYTLIEWKDTLQNFETLKQGDSAHLKFEFKNIGEIPLFILNTQVTCGCTVTAFSKDAVMPGKSGFIAVTFKAGNETGAINKKIIVITNTKNSRSSNLFIRGMVGQAGNK